MESPNIKTIELSNCENYAYIEEGDKDKKPLILLHGQYSSCFAYVPLIPFLAQKYHVFALDMRGFGESSYNKPINSLHDLADDIKLFCDKLQLKQVSLMGYSAGGGVSMSFAARYPDYLTHMILLCSIGPAGLQLHQYDQNGEKQGLLKSKEEFEYEPSLCLMKEAKETENYDNIFEFFSTWLFNGKTKVGKEQLIMSFKAGAFKQRNAAEIWYHDAHFNITNKNNGLCDGEGIAKNITAKILSISGKVDTCIPAEVSQSIKDTFGDKCVAKEYEEAGHFALYDYLQEISQDIINFVD